MSATGDLVQQANAAYAAAVARNHPGIENQYRESGGATILFQLIGRMTATAERGDKRGAWVLRIIEQLATETIAEQNAR
jgi:hypothetical protein